MPGHYDHPGLIEEHQAGQPLGATAEYWSGRALFVHNVKQPKDFDAVRRRWNLSRTPAPLALRCHASDALPAGTRPAWKEGPTRRGTSVGGWLPTLPRGPPGGPWWG